MADEARETFPPMMVGRYWCEVCQRHRPIVYAVGAEVRCGRCNSPCSPHNEDDRRADVVVPSQ